MSFGEFCDCLATFLLGKRNRQAHVLFKLIDEEGGGTLSKIELLQFFAGSEMDKEKKKVRQSLNIHTTPLCRLTGRLAD